MITTLQRLLSAMLPGPDRDPDTLDPNDFDSDGTPYDGDLFRICADDRELQHWVGIVRAAVAAEAVNSSPQLLEAGPEPLEGFTVVTNVDGSTEPGSRNAAGQVVVYAAERDAQLEIVDSIEEELRQFRAGERSFEELNCVTSDWAVACTLYPDGTVDTEEATFQPERP